MFFVLNKTSIRPNKINSRFLISARIGKKPPHPLFFSFFFFLQINKITIFNIDLMKSFLVENDQDNIYICI